VQGIHFRYAHSGNWSFQALLTAAGGRMMSEDDKQVAFNSPAGMAALDNLSAFVDRGGMVDMTPAQAQQAFAAGTIGIMSNSSSFLTGILKSAKGKFELVVASYPLAADAGRLPPGGNCATIAARKSERQQAAWEFVKFAVGSQAQLMLARQSGYVPVNGKAAAELIGRGDDPAQAVFRLPVSLLPRLTQWYGFPPPNGVKITDAIQGRLQSVVSKAATPEQAMQGMVADVEALLQAGGQ
jgi:multiple sugar transport system substrate-binding protein